MSYLQDGVLKVVCDPEKRLKRVPIAALQTFQGALKTLDDVHYDRLRASLEEEGFAAPVFVWHKHDKMLDGHQRLLVCEREEWSIEGGVPIVEIEAADEQEAARKLLRVYTAVYGQIDAQGLYDFATAHELDVAAHDLPLPDFDVAQFQDDFYPENGAPYDIGDRAGNMLEKFVVPPFSVLDTRQGYWQERKRKWLSLGIKSELGRDVVTYDLPDKFKKIDNDGSVFDPVLTELAVRWFCPPGGIILDPFAGGSVRGIVSSMLGRQYIGIDLSEKQIEANKEQIDICNDPLPVWIQGDSATALPQDVKADLILSCPPYGNLEKYSDHISDISNMEHAAFLDAYGGIISKAVELLKVDRFAVFVVADFRNGDGEYSNFVSATIDSFLHADDTVSLYNEAILINAIGTLLIRAGRQFLASRKLGKMHQNVLVFIKGDAKKATEAIGDILCGEIEETEEEEYGEVMQ